MFLLDTNVISELKKPHPDDRCMAWVDENEHQSVIPVIAISELRYGIERLTDGKKKAQFEKEFSFLMEDFEGRFFDFDGNAAAEWGRYAAELEKNLGTDWWKHVDVRDTQIAAIAREYGLTIATRNTKHFPFCDTVNPFKSE